MRYETFLGQVQARARLDSPGAAETATRASLETLAERVPATLAENLAAQLPREVGDNLRRVAHAPDGTSRGIRMSSQEFFDRVARRAGADRSEAAYEARCVIEVVDEATQGTCSAKLRPVLDDELARVLFAGSSGKP